MNEWLHSYTHAYIVWCWIVTTSREQCRGVNPLASRHSRIYRPTVGDTIKLRGHPENQHGTVQPE